MADPASIIGASAQPACECINATGLPAAAAKRVDSFVHLRANWRALRKAADALRGVEKSVKVRVEAERNMLYECDPQVQVWLRRVDELPMGAIDEEYDKFAQCSCLCRALNVTGRYRLGKGVVEMLEDVNRLSEEGRRFETFSYKPLPELVEEKPRTLTFGMEPVRRKLHDLFDRGDANIIGVWGQGGVGKTTLLNVFNNDLKTKASDYQVVFAIEVSNSETLNVADIQLTISERLGLPWNDAEAEDKRARFLVKALARKRFVILLDDVRESFRPEDVGIPTPDRESKSKLILTSRYRDVCHQMGAQKCLIEMQILDEDAAWNLFRSNLSSEAMAAIDSPDPNSVVRRRAVAVARRCGGLPLALNVIGRSMAGLTEPREWSMAASEIDANMAGFEGVDQIFTQLKYSYDRLTPTQQQCFLYCTLFPEYGSINTDQLVNYWKAEGLIAQYRDNGYRIIHGLVSACLLQISSSTSFKVKMHHVIRQMGLWLATTRDKFVVRAGMALEDAPPPSEWKQATRMSLMSNNIRGLCLSPKCRNLTTLLVQNNRNLDRLAPGFFKFMSCLRVLDLSHTAITALPDCDELVGLQHLNLSHTRIVRLPERLWMLKELRHLDLSVTGALEDTFDNCSKLHKLRVLNLFRSHYGVRDVGDLNLDSLKELLFLGITVYATDVLKKLNKTHPLAKPTHRLNLKYCRDMQSMRVSDLNHMVHLEELYVESCYDLNELLADADESRASRLEFLTLAVLPSFETVTIGPAPHHFQNVRKLAVSKCPKLRNVTWVLRLEALERLVISHCDGMEQVLQEEPVETGKSEQPGVQHRKRENSFSEEQEIHAMVEDACNDWTKGHQNKHENDKTNGATHVDFPKLRSIVLSDLKKLSSICNPRCFPSLESIKVEDCPNLRRIPLCRSYDCARLKQICGSSDWWESLQWEDATTEMYLENNYYIPI